MNELISLYNNSLIYFPNIFFLLLLILGTTAVFFLKKVSILVKEKAAVYVKKFKESVKQIHINKKPRIKIGLSIKRIIKNILIIISLIFLYIELKTDKIIKKIEKEILINEK